jgi:hypothetical protein
MTALAVDVEVVELVPDPVHSEVIIGVDVDDDVAEDVDTLGIAGEAGEILIGVGDEDPMAGYGIEGHVVMYVGESDLLAEAVDVAGGVEVGLEGSESELMDDGVGVVDFDYLEDGPVRSGAAV